MQISNPNPNLHLHEIKVSNEPNLNQQIKLNSRTMTKLNIDRLYLPLHFTVGKRKMIIFKKTATIFLQEKLISSFIFSECPTHASQIIFLTSKLKHLKNITSLGLQSLHYCTPQFLKHLSLSLSNLKKLTSLTLNVPSWINLAPQHVTNLFFALRRLNYLTNFSLILMSPALGEKSCQALTSCLSKLIHLKSFTLSLVNARSLTPSFLSFLAPSFKKLLQLQNLNINLSQSGSIESQAIIDFFASLKGLKSLKSLALNLRGCTINIPEFDSISKGLNLLDPELLQSFNLGMTSNFNNESIRELGITLQRFPSLRELTLDFTDSHIISEIGLGRLVPCLQTLEMLSSLSLNFFSARNIAVGPVGIVASAIKPLVRLKSLYLDFTGHNSSDDLQLSSFSENLLELTGLKNLTLKFGRLINITDEGLMNFAAALKKLMELSTFMLNLSNLEKLTNKGIISLASAIGNLNKLTELSINFLGNRNLDKESTDSLGLALQNLSLLAAIYLNFQFCQSLAGYGDKFLAIFKALGEMKFLKKIEMNLPSKSCNEKDYQLNTKHVLDNTIFW